MDSLGIGVAARCWTDTETEQLIMSGPLALAFAKRADVYINMIEMAWGIIANAGGGDWSKESESWQVAAVTFRAWWHELLANAGDPPEVLMALATLDHVATAPVSDEAVPLLSQAPALTNDEIVAALDEKIAMGFKASYDKVTDEWNLSVKVPSASDCACGGNCACGRAELTNVQRARPEYIETPPEEAEEVAQIREDSKSVL